MYACGCVIHRSPAYTWLWFCWFYDFDLPVVIRFGTAISLDYTNALSAVPPPLSHSRCAVYATTDILMSLIFIPSLFKKNLLSPSLTFVRASSSVRKNKSQFTDFQVSSLAELILWVVDPRFCILLLLCVCVCDRLCDVYWQQCVVILLCVCSCMCMFVKCLELSMNGGVRHCINKHYY